MRRLLIFMLVLLIPAIAAACPVCFGSVKSPTTDGSNKAIFVMLGIVGFVQIGFVALFWSFWRRARSLRSRREQFRLIDGQLSLPRTGRT